MSQQPSKLSISTEDKIKNAAREVFLKKGYSATRTRDIAEESGENLALINYYFGSKEKLFRLIMMETMHQFLNSILPVFNDTETSLETKIELIVVNYTDLFIAQPHIPLFVINELHSGPGNFMAQSEFKDKLMHSAFFQQLYQKTGQMTGEPVHPLQIFVSIMGMILFPFIASPMLKSVGSIEDSAFIQLMQERKKLIPRWVEAIFNS